MLKVDLFLSDRSVTAISTLYYFKDATEKNTLEKRNYFKHMIMKYLPSV